MSSAVTDIITTAADRLSFAADLYDAMIRKGGDDGTLAETAAHARESVAALRSLVPPPTALQRAMKNYKPARVGNLG